MTSGSRRFLAAAVAFVALLVLPPDADAQGGSRLEGRLEGPVLAQVTRMVDSARAAGLPTEPLLDKALEGASKRAPGNRIVQAVRTLAGDLDGARTALGPRTAEPEIVAGAAALRAGATRRQLADLRAERSERPLTVPLAVLANLVARGVPSDTASAVVLQLARRGAPDADFTELERAVERDIGAGAPPAAAASVRGRGRGASGGRGGAAGGVPPDVRPPGEGRPGRGRPQPGPKPKKPKKP